MDNGAASAAQAGQNDPAQAGQQAAVIPLDQVDRVVRQRLEQAFNGVFGRLLATTEKAAAAAEASASSHKTESMMKGLKVDTFKPTTREEELRGWKEWWFGFSTYVCGHDVAYEDDFKGIDLNVEVDHSLLSDAEVERSRKLYSLLCSLLKGRPLLLIKGLQRMVLRLFACCGLPWSRKRRQGVWRCCASWQRGPSKVAWGFRSKS